VPVSGAGRSAEQDDHGHQVDLDEGSQVRGAAAPRGRGNHLDQEQDQGQALAGRCPRGAQRAQRGHPHGEQPRHREGGGDRFGGVPAQAGDQAEVPGQQQSPGGVPPALPGGWPTVMPYAVLAKSTGLIASR
jgi:hypothetical protein